MNAPQRRKKRCGRDAKELRRDARNFKNDARKALQGTGGSGPSESPDAKIHEGEERLRRAGNQASAKIDAATILARAKTNLAAEIGLRALTNIEVNVNGSAITLTGTVQTEAEKEKAEDSVSQIPGVTRVTNHLMVKP